MNHKPHKFEPENTLPTESELKCILTHEEIVKSLHNKIKDNPLKYIPAKGDGQSVLLAVYPSDDWKTHKHGMEFISAPRKHENMALIDELWTDKILNSQMTKLCKHETNLTVIFPIDSVDEYLFHHKNLYPYFANVYDAKNKNMRKKILRQIPKCEIMLVSKGIRNLPLIVAEFAKKHNVVSVGCIVHWFVDGNFNLKIKKNVDKSDIQVSNLSPWFKFNVNHESHAIQLAETSLVISGVLWQSFKNISLKHENLQTNNQTIDLTECKESPRISNATYNQTIEMDSRWFHFIHNKAKIDTANVQNKSFNMVGAYPVCNVVYKIPSNIVDKDCCLFDIFVHHHDINKCWYEKYLQSKKMYASVFEFIGLSFNPCVFDTIFFKPKKKAMFHEYTAELALNILAQTKSLHFWLPQNLYYLHCEDNERLQIKQYMTNLIDDFELNTFDCNPAIDIVWQILQEKMQNYVIDQWCLSLYSFRGSTVSPIKLQNIDKFKDQLFFEAGYETIFVIQPYWSEGDVATVHVHDCALSCTTQLGVVQLSSNHNIHNVNDTDVSVVCSDSLSVVLLLVLRRIPAVRN